MHDHDQGLAHDLDVLRRRRLLGLLAGAGGLGLMGFGGCAVAPAWACTSPAT